MKSSSGRVIDYGAGFDKQGFAQGKICQKQLVKYEKKFLLIGNINAITYKEIFKLIKENKSWLGINMGRGIFGFTQREMLYMASEKKLNLFEFTQFESMKNLICSFALFHVIDKFATKGFNFSQLR